MSVYVVITYFGSSDGFEVQIEGVYQNYGEALEFINNRGIAANDDVEESYGEILNAVYDVPLRDNDDRAAIVETRFFSGAPKLRRQYVRN